MAEGSVHVNSGYLRTPDAILKILEMIVSLVVFICGCVLAYWRFAGWLQFCGMFAFIVVLIFFLLKLLGLISRLPASAPWNLIEAIICVIFAIFFLICGIVGARWFRAHDAVSAATIFSFIDMVLFLISAFFLFREWKEGGSTVVTTSGGTTKTTTTVERG